MKPIAKARKLSTIFNIETDPVHFTKDELADLYAERPSGLTEPEPLFSRSRVVEHSFQGWPLMLIIAFLILALGGIIGILGQQLMETYGMRLFG